MTALYNENDKHAAEWLRNLIRDGEIAPGDVDERSIVDLRPRDLAGYTQVHLFAGVGVWSHSLRRIGWRDEWPILTGSCPCPPFSAAGKKKACPGCGGTNPIPHVGRTGYFVCCLCDHEWLADERHLWPEMWRIVRDHRPSIVLGEQVASGDGRVWFDAVRSSLEILDFAAGGIDTCSAGHGAPHIRQRLRIGAFDRRSNELGVALGVGLEGFARHGDDRREPGRFDAQPARPASPSGDARGLAHSEGGRRREFGSEARARDLRHVDGGSAPSRRMGDSSRGGVGTGLRDHGSSGLRRDEPANADRDGRLADAIGGQLPFEERRPQGRDGDGSNRAHDPDLPGIGHNRRPGPVNGFWRDSDWLYCRDEKWRPVKSITFEMADGPPAFLGPLRANLVEEAEREILNVCSGETNARKAMSNLWRALSETTICWRPIGGLRAVHEPSVLLYFMLKLSEQGRPLAKSIPCTSAEVAEADVRGLRWLVETSRASYRRGLAQQRPEQHSDAMRLLPSILARYAQKAWGKALDAYAQDAFPLVEGSSFRVGSGGPFEGKSRTGMLRGYGNAVDAEATAAFCEAVLCDIIRWRNGR